MPLASGPCASGERDSRATGINLRLQTDMHDAYMHDAGKGAKNKSHAMLHGTLFK